MSKLLIGLVNVTLGFNRQGGADKSKERGIEINRAVRIERHVHWDQTLKRIKNKSVWNVPYKDVSHLCPRAERWRQERYPALVSRFSGRSLSALCCRCRWSRPSWSSTTFEWRRTTSRWRSPCRQVWAACSWLPIAVTMHSELRPVWRILRPPGVVNLIVYQVLTIPILTMF